MIRSLVPPARPLTPQAFAELMGVLRLGASSEEEGPYPPVAMLQGMAAAAVVLLRQPQPLIWFTSNQCFVALRMSTTEGEQYGLPFGDVVVSFEQAQAAARAYLGANEVAFLEPESVWQIRSALPEGFCPPRLSFEDSSVHHAMGVGVLFEKLRPEPLDEKAVVKILASFSCHPYFGERLVKDLNANGERITTVMSLFARTLPDVVRVFEPLGVRVARTWPKPGAGHSQLPEEISGSYKEYLAATEV